MFFGFFLTNKLFFSRVLDFERNHDRVRALMHENKRLTEDEPLNQEGLYNELKSEDMAPLEETLAAIEETLEELNHDDLDTAVATHLLEAFCLVEKRTLPYTNFHER